MTTFKDEISVIVGGYQGSGVNFPGHVAIACTGEGTYSYGTKTEAGSPLVDYLTKQAAYRNSILFMIPASRTQINVIVSYLKTLPRFPDVFAEPDRAYDTCASRTNEALPRAGLMTYAATRSA